MLALLALLTLADRSFEDPVSVLVGTATLGFMGSAVAPTLADLDGDGLPDLVIGLAGCGNVAWARNVGKAGAPKFEKHDLLEIDGKVQLEPYCDQTMVVALADLSGDGRLDMVAGLTNGEVWHYPSSAEGLRPGAPVWQSRDPRTPRPVRPGEARWREAAISLADWNGDGLLDIVVGLVDGEVFLLRNSGTKSARKFERPERIEGLAFGRGSSPHPVAVDWNGDGKLDLVVGLASGEVDLVLRKEDGGFESPKPLPGLRRPLGLGKPVRLSVVDWNGDGKPDLLIGGGMPGPMSYVSLVLAR